MSELETDVTPNVVVWKPFKTMVKEYGEDSVMNKIMESLVEGKRPDAIAKSLKIPFYEFMKWIHEDTKRLHGYHRAQELWAESLHAEVIEIADSATEEDVQVAKLRIKTRQEVAANYSKKRFGKVEIPENKGFSGGITINITGVEKPKFVEVVQDLQVELPVQKEILVQKEEVFTEHEQKETLNNE